MGLLHPFIPPCMKDVCFRGDALVKDERQPVDVQPWLAKWCGRPEREKGITVATLMKEAR